MIAGEDVVAMADRHDAEYKVGKKQRAREQQHQDEQVMGAPTTSKIGTELSNVRAIPSELVHQCVLPRLASDAQRRLRYVSRAWSHALHPSITRPLQLALHILRACILLRCYPPADSFDPTWPSCWELYDPESGSSRTISPPRLRSGPLHHVYPHPIPYITAFNSSGHNILAGLEFQHCAYQKEGLFLLQASDVSRPWSQALTNPPLVTRSFGSAVLDGYFYLAGGANWCFKTAHRCAMRLRVTWSNLHPGPHSDHHWESLPDMHLKRIYATALVLRGCLYVFGGYAAVEPPESQKLKAKELQNFSGEIYDPTQQTWQLVPELWPHSIHKHPSSITLMYPQVVVVRERLYALERATTGHIFVYDEATKKWSSLGRAPTTQLVTHKCVTRSAQHSYQPRLFGVGFQLWLSSYMLDTDNNGKNGWLEFSVADIPDGPPAQALAWRTRVYALDSPRKIFDAVILA